MIANSGEVIERWLACGDGPPLVLENRARILTGRARRRLATWEATQEAPERRTLAQPGLFEVHDLARSRQAAVVDEETNPVEANFTVRVGEPRPVLILERRR